MMSSCIIGADISKDHIDLHRLPDNTRLQIANNEKGFKALVKWLGTTALERIVFEPTGAHHKAFEAFLASQGLAFSKVNPRHVRQVAEIVGKRAKTDRADAEVLARFGQAFAPRIGRPNDEIMNKLKALHAARNGLVKDRTAARNRSKMLTIELLKRQSAQRLKQIDVHIADIDRAILELINASEPLKQRFDILISSPAISAISACALLIEMPELGTLDNKAAAALAGLAPITRQSGTWKGKSFIAGGRAMLRQAMFMPALVAIRFNPDFEQKYKAMLKAGKPKKLAITAIMRKLVVLANTLLKHQRKWMPKPT
jgi:transposase